MLAAMFFMVFYSKDEKLEKPYQPVNRLSSKNVIFRAAPKGFVDNGYPSTGWL